MKTTYFHDRDDADDFAASHPGRSVTYWCETAVSFVVETELSPSQQAKEVGLDSLTQVSQMTGVSLQTLTNWHRDKPKLFAVVLAGCKATNET